MKLEPFETVPNTESPMSIPFEAQASEDEHLEVKTVLRQNHFEIKSPRSRLLEAYSPQDEGLGIEIG